MSTLRPQLWKEWREHRLVLGVLALLVPVSVLGVAGLAGSRTFGQPDVPFFFALLAALGVVMTIGSEILAGEDGARLRFLERLPGGLAAAFRAKLLFYGAALLALEVWAVLVTIGVSFCRTGRLPEFRLGDAVFLLVLAHGALALWPLAVSAWTPRGSLSLPLAALVLGVLAWPCWLLIALWGYRPASAEIVGAVALLLAGALATSSHGFVRCRAHGGTRLGTAGHSLGIAALFLCPTWAWGGLRLHEYFAFDPSQEDLWITGPKLGAGGRFAFLTAGTDRARWKAAPFHALVVDLESGRWQDVGGRRCLEAVPRTDDGSLEHWPDVACDFRVVDYETRSTVKWLDGSTGRELPAQECIATAVDWDDPVGLGFRGGPGHRGEIWDPYRRRFFQERKTVPRGIYEDVAEILVVPSGWLLRCAESPAWQQLDPATGELHALEWPDDKNKRHPLLADGRVFLNLGGALVLADPSDDSLVELSLPEGVRADFLRSAYGSRSFRSDQPILLMTVRGYLAVDLERRTTALIPDVDLWLIGPLSDGSLLACNGHRLLALDLATGERRVLFPKP